MNLLQSLDGHRRTVRNCSGWFRNGAIFVVAEIAATRNGVLG